jgi:two-component system chemotaxis sensor kinase CheA
MQRIVRDTSSDLGKKVNLILEGEDTELDKTILERISDPLVHLIRNACDHGIESPTQRVAAGKGETGTLKLSAFHQSGKLVIKISDDGAGIDPEILRRKASEKKIISPNAQLTDKEAISLIFHPGFSTKAVVTDVSGRGVGMDVVKFNIESIQGEVLIDTEVGKGTTFKILLPLTLAIIDAMVVKLNDLRYVIPLSHIQESVKLEQKDVKKTTGLGEILLLRGDNIPLFHLTDLLIKKNTLKNENAHSIAVVIKSSQETFAVIVDDIIGQYQVVIKKLGSEIQELKGIAGSAILGDGKPALILELAELVNKNKKVFNSDLRGVAI